MTQFLSVFSIEWESLCGLIYRMKAACNDNQGVAARCGWESASREEKQNPDREKDSAPEKDGEKQPDAQRDYVKQRLRELALFEWRYRK